VARRKILYTSRVIGLGNGKHDTSHRGCRPSRGVVDSISNYYYYHYTAPPEMCTRRTRYARVAGRHHEVQLAYRYITLGRESSNDPLFVLMYAWALLPIICNVYVYNIMVCSFVRAYLYKVFFFFLFFSGNDFFLIHIVFPERAHSDLSSETHGGPTAPHPPRYNIFNKLLFRVT